MGKGSKYKFVEYLIAQYVSADDIVLEIGAGGAVYRENFKKNVYVASDIKNENYQSVGDIAVYASGNCLPFRNNSFTFIFSQAAFDYIQAPKKVLSECFRVLKDGGTLLIITYNKKTLTRIHKEELAKNVMSHHVYTIKQLLGWLKESGFEGREILKPKYYEGRKATVAIKTIISRVPIAGYIMQKLTPFRIVIAIKHCASE